MKENKRFKIEIGSMLFALALLCTSCGGEQKNSGKVKAVALKTQNQVLKDGKLVTQYSQKHIVKCALKDIENNRSVPLTGYSRSTGRRFDTKLDVEIPASLTRKITSALKEKAKAKKLSPSMFWDELSLDLQNELVEILINQDVNRSEKDFRRLKQEIAFAYLIYIENPTENDGYRLLSKDENGKTKLTKISFTQKTKYLKVVRPCKGFKMDEVYISEGLKTPKNITAKILCENSEGEKISISGVSSNNLISPSKEELWIHIISKDLKDNLKLIKEKVNIVGDRRWRRSLFYEGNEIYNYKYLVFDIKKKSAKEPSSIRSMEFTTFTNSGKLIKIRKLKCETVKELIF